MPAVSRALLWEYLGHPDDETPERRRVLYAIVVLRVGLGLLFLLRGWVAVFASTPEGFAIRLGDPALWGLGGDAARDQALFILGCTELLVGLFLVVGVFTRVSAVTGGVLLLLYLLAGADPVLDPTTVPGYLCIDRCPPHSSPVAGAITDSAMLAGAGGLLLLVVCGSPFLSADRFLDKVEEEERDRLPAVLPHAARWTPLFLRLGLAAGSFWLMLHPSGPGWMLVVMVSGGLSLPPLLLGAFTRCAGPLAAGAIALLAGLALPGGEALALAAAAVAVGAALALTGGGHFSVDHYRASREKPEPAGTSALESPAARNS